MIARTVILSLALLMAETQPMRSDWTVRGNISSEKFIIQAHRGAGDLAPENTLEAFELGWKLNCIPESDLRTTKDGVIVAFHDSNFARVVKNIDPAMAKLGVKDITFEELSKLDVGGWKGEQFVGRRVSRISDVFKLMKDRPERKLYLDIKNADLDQLAREVKEAGVEKQVILASTKYDQVRTWKKLAPDSETLLWLGGKGSDTEVEARFVELRENNFEGVTQIQIHTHLPEGVSSIKRDVINPFKETDAFLIARGDELRKRGILYQTLPYGGSGREIYLKLLDLGFMSLATDQPEITWDAVKAFYGGK